MEPGKQGTHGDSPGKNTGVGCHALLHGIFPTQGSNPGLLHCRQILYHLKPPGKSMSLACEGITEFSGAPKTTCERGVPGCRCWGWGAGSHLSTCKKSTPWQQLQPAGTRSRQESLFGQNRKPPEGKCGLASVNP